MVKTPVEMKRVAAVFHELTRVRNPCESSSGSEHYSPQDPDDLSDLVESFMETEGKVDEDAVIQSELGENELEEDLIIDVGSGVSNCNATDHDVDDDTIVELRNLVECKYGFNDFERRFVREIEDACLGLRESNSSSRSYKRLLMTHLRDKGFDAGLCKLLWEKFGRNPAGSYEYIDINMKGNRYIVEENLSSEFQIARPTPRYLSLLHVFPTTFVGKPEDLKKIVRIMCNAIRKSLKKMEISVPPWRRNGYMQAKWFGTYKRTTNRTTAREATCYNNHEVVVVGTRLVGFEAIQHSMLVL